MQSADDPPRYLPARDPSFISVAQVLDALRSAGEARFLAPDALPTSAPVEQALEKVQSAVESAVGATSLREFEQDQSKKQLLKNARRGVHTIKGAGAILGLWALAKLAKRVVKLDTRLMGYGYHIPF